MTYYENAINYGEQHVNFFKLNKKDISDNIDLSIQHQLLCSNTAFVFEVCVLEDQFKQLVKQKVIAYQTNLKFKIFEDVNLLKSVQYQKSMGCIKLNKSYKRQEASGCCGIGGTQNYKPKQNIFYLSPSSRSYSFQNLQKLQETIQKVESSDIAQSDELTYQQLVNFAQADGSFKINNEIKNKIIFKNCKNIQSLNENILVTFVVLLYLDNFLKEFKRSWQLVYQKGILYLEQNGIAYKLKRDEIQVDI